MADYNDQLAAMLAAQDAMKTKPKVSDAALRAGLMGGVQALKDTQKPSKQSMQEAADEATRRREEMAPTTKTEMGNKKGGKVCGMKKGGKVRGCGCAQRGLTKGRMV